VITNPIIGTDSYKVSHYKQYPPGTGIIDSYFECRGMSKRMQEIHDLAVGPSAPMDAIFFGALQYYLPQMLRRITKEDIAEAAELFAAHFGTLDFFNRDGWERILNKHGGHLPLRVRAIPEGTRLPVSNALLTVQNLDDELPWLTNYTETRLSHIWYPTTVATLSYYCRQIILKWLEKNGTPSEIDFKLHDFGYRGVECEQAAAVGGLAHLLNFKGTDTMAALALGKKYYKTMPGFSIPAAEHSTITTWGGPDSEYYACRNMLKQYPNGPVAVVSDSFNIYAACEKLWGEMLRDEVLQRNGVLVIRPDSGDPLTVLPAVLYTLMDKFGYSQTRAGHKTLNPKVRVIQGDGVTPVEIDRILTRLDELGFSADNLAFGMGGGLLQQVNRDDLKCAFKCSAITFHSGLTRGVWKKPITDPGKNSKSGKLTCYSDGTKFFTAERGLRDHREVMQTVWEDGFLLIDDSLDVIRDRVSQTAVAEV
jgi:nicotinamide phosphoribosyltransferase